MSKDRTWNTDPRGTKELATQDGKPTFVNQKKSLGAGAKPTARMCDTFSCPKPAPHKAVFLMPTQTGYWVDGLPVIRLADFGLDLGGADVVMEGAATFLVCGLPVSRKDDKMHHGGLITQGSDTLMIGGPTFSLPSNVKVAGTAKFNQQVLRDLYFLSKTKAGGVILDRIDAHGKPVKIVNRANTTTTVANPPLNHKEYGKREGKYGHDPDGSVIGYNPDKQDAYSEDEQGNPLPIPPQIGLGHELIHAVHIGEGKAHARMSEEAATVGFPRDKYENRKYGNKAGSPAPTENDLREELGLAIRANYNTRVAPNGEMSPNLRPGECS